MALCKYRRVCLPLFSPEDADLARIKWLMSGSGYAYKRRTREPVIYAHKEVCLRRWGRYPDLSKWEVTDHINRDQLDNRRANIRITTKQENFENSAACENARGFRKVGHKWFAYVRVSGQFYNLGYYSTQREARDSYLSALKILRPSRYKSILKKHGLEIPSKATENGP